MSELPGRPNLDQLRRQARELLRAAVDGEPAALTRIRAFSPRVSLSAAQLTLAREYGFASWPALHAAVESRLAELPLGEDSTGRAGTRWSFGGAAALETPAGTLYPGGLLAGPDHASMDASLMASGETWPRLVPTPGDASTRERGREAATQAAVALAETVADTVVVTDDQGTTYALRARGITRDGERGLVLLDLRVDPVPPAECAWLELGVRDGAAVRLLPSARPVTHVRRLAPVPDTPAARERSAHAPALTDAQAEDGPQLHLDLAAVLPGIDDIVVRVDSLFSEPGTWRVYLSAEPSWWIYSADRQRKWPVMAVHAEDDLGGRYVSEFGGSSSDRAREELILSFQPRLNPAARTLILTFRPFHPVTEQVTGGAEPVTVELRLP